MSKVDIANEFSDMITKVLTVADEMLEPPSFFISSFLFEGI